MSTEAQKEYQRQYRLKHHAEKSAYNRAYALNHKAEKLAYNRKYYTDNKGAILKQVAGYRRSHRAERNAWNKKSDALNPERKRERQRRWDVKNGWRFKGYRAQRIARRKSATIDAKAALWFYGVVHNQDVLTCAYCEKNIPASKAHVDHIVPLSRGGLHATENFCIACDSCNLSKHDKLLTEWPKCPPRIFNLIPMI